MIEKEILKEVSSRILQNKTPVLQTGFKNLDIALSGVEQTSIITIGARPAMGKSCFMSNIMLNLLQQNKKCMYFSLEMSIQQFLKRLLGQISELDFYTLNNSDIISNSWKYSEMIKEAVDKLSEYNLTIYDEIINIDKIQEKIEQERPDFVFIDYLQLIETPNKRPRTESFEKIMLNLKKIAKNNNCIIFVISELSRILESRCDRRPLLSDLRESGAIENLSDVVMFIYRDAYYYDYSPNEEKDSNLKGKTEIIIAKNKYGPNCKVKLLFRDSIMKFLEPI